MDYEKKYNEALERARKAYNAIPPESRGARKIIEDAFPELRESDDEQKPAWSKEDEKMLSDLRNTLGCLMNAGAITFKTKKKFSNWLKRLRPSWKPSEEQLNALYRAAEHFQENHFVCTPLLTLYEQLKKL